MSAYQTSIFTSQRVHDVALRVAGMGAAVGLFALVHYSMQNRALEVAQITKAKAAVQASSVERDVAFMAARAGLEAAIHAKGQAGGFMLMGTSSVGRRDIFAIAQPATGCSWVVESERWNKAPLNPVSVEPKKCGVAPAQSHPASQDKVSEIFASHAPELGLVARGGYSERYALVETTSATRSADRVVMIDLATGCRLIGRIDKFGASAPMPDGAGMSCKE